MQEPSIDVMAGWTVKPSSGMANVYDSVTASSELLYKDFTHRNFHNGWSLMPEGTIPLNPVVGFKDVSRDQPAEHPSPAKKVSTQRGGGLQLRRMADSPLDDSVVQCLHSKLGSIHLAVIGVTPRGKEPKTVCGRWVCGTPDMPAETADFASISDKWTGVNSAFAFCERCYGDCYPVGRCLSTPKKTKGSPKASSLASSSSSSSEAESSAVKEDKSWLRV